MTITIANEIRTLVPEFHMAIIEVDVVVEQSTRLNQAIDVLEKEIRDNIDIKDVVSLDVIKDGRDAYKRFGKDPSRYRLAVESLYRRIAKNNPLYRINNIVDLGNMISLQTRKSVAMLNKDNIEGDITIRLGREDDLFYGIGRGKLNVNRIPIYEDKIGPFGSVTSDTDRTKITKDTKKCLMFIISFSGKAPLKDDIMLTKRHFETYISYQNFNSKII